MTKESQTGASCGRAQSGVSGDDRKVPRPRDCTKESKPLVFDADGKPLDNPAAAKGAMNVIDALKVLGVPERTAQRVSTVDELMKLGIDPRNMFKFKFKLNLQNTVVFICLPRNFSTSRTSFPQ